MFVSLLKDFADLNQDAMTKKDQGSSAPRMSTIISYPSPETINLMSKDRKQAYHVGLGFKKPWSWRTRCGTKVRMVLTKQLHEFKRQNSISKRSDSCIL